MGDDDAAVGPALDTSGKVFAQFFIAHFFYLAPSVGHRDQYDAHVEVIALRGGQQDGVAVPIPATHGFAGGGGGAKPDALRKA